MKFAIHLPLLIVFYPCMSYKFKCNTTTIRTSRLFPSATQNNVGACWISSIRRQLIGCVKTGGEDRYGTVLHRAVLLFGTNRVDLGMALSTTITGLDYPTSSNLIHPHTTSRYYTILYHTIPYHSQPPPSHLLTLILLHILIMFSRLIPSNTRTKPHSTPYYYTYQLFTNNIENMYKHHLTRIHTHTRAHTHTRTRIHTPSHAHTYAPHIHSLIPTQPRLAALSHT